MNVMSDSVLMNSPERDSQSAPVELSDAQRQVIAELRSAQRADVIACAFCDIDSPQSLEAAMLTGWKGLQIDDGFSWNYLGVCPDCKSHHSPE